MITFSCYPCIADNPPLVSEVSTEGGQEEKVDVVTKEPDSVETKDDTTNDGNVPKPEAPLQTEAASSWWDYTASYTNKLKQSAQTLQQSAQNFDYNKISTKIGKLFKFYAMFFVLLLSIHTK